MDVKQKPDSHTGLPLYTLKQMIESLCLSSSLLTLAGHLPPTWLSVSGPRRGQGEPASDSVQGQGHSAGQERTEPRPHQHRAALMKGQAAWRPSGYTDLGLIGLMRCGEVRYHRTEAGQSRGGRDLLLSIMGQKEKDFFLFFSSLYEFGRCFKSLEVTNEKIT